MEKRIISAMIGIMILVFLIGLVSANQCNDGIDNDLDGSIDYPADSGCISGSDNDENVVLGYADGCLGYGDKLMDVFGKEKYACWHDRCDVCVMITEAGNYSTDFGRCSSSEDCAFAGGSGGSGGSNIDSEPPNLTISSPVEGELYDSRKVLFDIESNEPASLYYLDVINGRGRWKRLRSLTMDYEREISLKDGLNELIIKGRDRNGRESFYNVSFFVDSKDPKIKKTYPKKGFADGFFEVEIDEANPDELILYYGVEGDIREGVVDLEGCVEDKRKTRCSIEVELDDFNGENIEYWFVLEDIVGNVDESKHLELSVDITPPVLINSENFWEQGDGRYNKYIYFTFEVDEDNFDEIIYYDWNDKRPKWKKLCSRLKDGICEKRKSFKDGEHVVDIKILDEAGNPYLERIEFSVE